MPSSYYASNESEGAGLRSKELLCLPVEGQCHVLCSYGGNKNDNIESISHVDTRVNMSVRTLT